MIRLAGGVLLAIALIGCNGKSTVGARVQTSEEFKPAALYSDQALLLYGGTEVAVAMERQDAGSLVKFVLTAHGQVFETESYQSSGKAFAFVGIDDTFDPPIPLLKFPMQIGDKWNWKGSLKSTAMTHPATADVSTTRESIFVAGIGDIETLRSDIRLFLDSGTPTPAERKLSFWFVRGRGVVKREIGTATIRQPAKPTKETPAKESPSATQGG